jgi:hypothetical protein
MVCRSYSTPPPPSSERFDQDFPLEDGHLYYLENMQAKTVLAATYNGYLVAQIKEGDNTQQQWRATAYGNNWTFENASGEHLMLPPGVESRAQLRAGTTASEFRCEVVSDTKNALQCVA